MGGETIMVQIFGDHFHVYDNGVPVLGRREIVRGTIGENTPLCPQCFHPLKFKYIRQAKVTFSPFGFDNRHQVIAAWDK